MNGEDLMMLEHEESEMSYHFHVLSRSCRVCGTLNLNKPGQLYNKYQFKRELTQLYNVDIESDKQDIHSKLLCRSHLRTLQKTNVS